MFDCVKLVFVSIYEINYSRTDGCVKFISNGWQQQWWHDSTIRYKYNRKIIIKDLVKEHPMNLSPKFGSNWPSGYTIDGLVYGV